MPVVARSRERALFYRQLATMLDAGLSPLQALTALGRQGGATARRAREVEERIGDGRTDLGEAVAAGEMEPRVGEARATLLRAAWHSGRFVPVLRSLAREAEEEGRSLARFQGALLRPAILAFLTPVILALPAAVRGGAVAWAKAALPPLVLVAGVLVVLLRAVRSVPRVRKGLPLLGPYAGERAEARACLVLHHLFEAGSAPAPALREAARAAGPGPEGAALASAASGVERGMDLATALDAGALSAVTVQFLATGEAAGDLSRMAWLAHVHHRDEAERRFRSLARALVAASMAAAFAWAGWRIVRGMGEALRPIERIR